MVQVVKRMGSRYRVMVLALVGALLGSAAFAGQPSTPLEALDLGSVATTATAALTTMVGDALPFIGVAIALGIGLRWARRIFKF